MSKQERIAARFMIRLHGVADTRADRTWRLVFESTGNVQAANVEGRRVYLETMEEGRALLRRKEY